MFSIVFPSFFLLYPYPEENAYLLSACFYINQGTNLFPDKFKALIMDQYKETISKIDFRIQKNEKKERRK